MSGTHLQIYEAISSNLKKNVPRLIKKSFTYYDQINIITNRASIIPLILYCKNHTLCLYKILSDVIAYDVPGKKYRFCMIYSLFSHLYNARLNIYTYTNESIWLHSVTNLYKSANWQEREVFDLVGIYFKNHPDLRRILTDYGFQGFPFRKDFPVMGFLEQYYDERNKLICSNNIELAADFRIFKTTRNW